MCSYASVPQRARMSGVLLNASVEQCAPNRGEAARSAQCACIVRVQP